MHKAYDFRIIETERTEWHNIVMWGGLAESAARLLKKGTLIYIEGKASTRSFIDKEGNKKYSTEIILLTISPCWDG
jgi:single-strand DNA-binding protein